MLNLLFNVNRVVTIVKYFYVYKLCIGMVKELYSQQRNLGILAWR